MPLTHSLVNSSKMKAYNLIISDDGHNFRVVFQYIFFYPLVTMIVTLTLNSVFKGFERRPQLKSPLGTNILYELLTHHHQCYWLFSFLISQSEIPQNQYNSPRKCEFAGQKPS